MAGSRPAKCDSAVAVPLLSQHTQILPRASRPEAWVETRPAGAVAESPELGPCPGSLQRSATGRRKTVRASGPCRPRIDVREYTPIVEETGCARRSRPSRWPLGPIRGVWRVSQKTLNLGILAHVDAGKTTLTERLLYHLGRHRRARQRRCRDDADRFAAAGAAARHHDQVRCRVVPDRRRRRQPDRHAGPPGFHRRGGPGAERPRRSGARHLGR